MKLENQNILIVSNEPWGPFWYSKHNYANELSKKNKVFFLDPPGAFLPDNILKKEIREEKISSRLTILKYNNIYPVSVLNFWKWNDKVILKALSSYFKKQNISDILFWTFDPIRLGSPELLEPKKIILHVVDDYLFSYPTEYLLAKKADVIISVSDKIAVNYKNYNPNIHVIRHALPDDEFLPVSPKRNDPATGIFIGKIDKRIDLDFNLEVFRSFPQVKFKIIGSVDKDLADKINAAQLKNVLISPPVPSGQLKYEVSGADFCFIFKKIYKGNNIFSHKLLQYLAQGKPIFGTDFSDIDESLKKTLYLNNDPGEIKTMLQSFLKDGEDSSKAGIRVNYARQNTFTKALAHIETFLN